MVATIDDRTYEGRWFVENGVVNLYVGLVGPMTTALSSGSGRNEAHLLFREYISRSASRNAK
jgi:hypothetical protein